MADVKAHGQATEAVTDTPPQPSRHRYCDHSLAPGGGRTPAVFAIGAVFAWLLLVMLVFVLLAAAFESVRGRGHAVSGSDFL